MFYTSCSRRQVLRWAGSTAMATTFLPVAGKYRVWSHPSANRLLTRPLGRTGREVTTFGLAGGNKVMWNLPGDEGVEIIVKAVRSGLTYLETANNYQLSQLNYNKAFRIRTHFEENPATTRRCEAGCSSLQRPVCAIVSSGMARSRWDARREEAVLALKTWCVRSLSSSATARGYIPEGAYIDLMQIHTLTRDADVDAVFEGLENPSDKSIPRLGALAGLIDFRDGTNLTGLNPREKKYIRHIGITGHENPTAHMYAMRRGTPITI